MFILFLEYTIVSIGILLAYVLLYMMSAQKVTVLTPLLIVGMSFLLRDKDSLMNYLALGISVLSLLVLLNVDSPFGFSIGFLLFVRTICICPLLFVVYTRFFLSNPYTFYSHIGIVNSLTQMYPYDDMLGKAVSVTENNANAFFGTTDGVAAWGATGLVVISVVFVFYLLFLNKLPSKTLSKKYLMLMFVPTLTSLLNCSLFTYFVSHGIFILVLLILFVRIPDELRG